MSDLTNGHTASRHVSDEADEPRDSPAPDETGASDGQSEGGSLASTRQPKLIAFYLPQYHPIPENDRWWGPGFTEWTSVTSGQPMFDGHVMPHLPADLGFYDLRLREARAAQADLARKYGIHGFCYYFYWFAGKRLLERPLDAMIADGEPDLPFCLCWANEPWSRRWDGSEQDVLMPQSYDTAVDVHMLDAMLPFLQSDRYIQVEGKPLLLIYRILALPNPEEFVLALRRRAEELGLPGLHICSVMSFGSSDPAPFGCDSSVEFPPHAAEAAELQRELVPGRSVGPTHIYDYEDLVARQISQPDRPFRYFPGVMPRWDNTARNPRGNVYHGSTPELFETWLSNAAERSLRLNPDDPLVFINSWNEWGEGAHLEPDRRYGRQYLDAVRRVAASDRAHSLRLLESAAADREAPRIANRILVENDFLTRRLAEANELRRPLPVFAGYPDGLRRMKLPDFEGRMNVERVNSYRFDQASRAVVPRSHVLLIQGWFLPAWRSSKLSYVVMTSDLEAQHYFSVIHEWERRADVVAYHETVDGSEDCGFSLRLDIRDMARGVYTIHLVDVTVDQPVQMRSTIELEVV